jgi:DnaJ-class molecular chaperone
MADVLRPPLEDTNPDALRSRILARYAIVEAGDYFQVLGVPREATAAEARRAHERIARELAPGAIEEKLASELGPQIEAIRVVTLEAVRILSDERLRPRYLSKLS